MKHLFCLAPISALLSLAALSGCATAPSTTAIPVVAPVPGAEPKPNDGKNHAFTLGSEDFLLDGKPFQIRGGEIHPERVPREYWRHRIQMAKAMGLNAISIYVFWSQHEAEEGKFDFKTGNLDTAEFCRIAQSEGMWIVLRPGPYCCAEYDFGGIPTYLLRHKDLKIRCMDPHYMAAVERYFKVLAAELRPLQVSQGGPIIMTQIENEYGSYAPGHDREYLGWLSGFWRGAGFDTPFYTADGPDEAHIGTGMVMGGALGMDPGENDGQFALARRMGNNQVPTMCSEIYPGWLTHWGEGWAGHGTLSGQLDFFMRRKHSFGLYMIHGGSNFGFMAGANSDSVQGAFSGVAKNYQPDITSYDYSSPISEQGCAASNYGPIREKISSYLPAADKPGPIPAPIPAMRIPEIKMERWTSLWQNLPVPIACDEPKLFEDIGQNQGIVLYRHEAPVPAGKLVAVEAHDYTLVFAGGKSAGTLNRCKHQDTLALPAEGPVSGAPGLDLLVEGMGHINFASYMVGDRKGLLGGVTVDGKKIEGWQMYPFPLKSAWITALPKAQTADGHPGGIFKGHFQLDTVADTFIDMSQWQKGMVWVNGHNLGRYWNIGPQFRLYCPAPWMKKGDNEIIVLDLHQTSANTVRGMLSH